VSATTKALGRWPNAPLALVLAQVRFEPRPETTPAQVAERIERAMPSAYLNTGALQQVSLLVGQGTPPSMSIPSGPVGMEMRNADDTEAIRLQNDSLTYTTAAYQDSDHMAKLWGTFMEALCGGKPLLVLRLGLRYVDFIIPTPGHTPEDYFEGGLGRSPAPLGEQSPISFNLYDFRRPDGGHLRVQYQRGYGAPMLPADLQDSLMPPPALTTRNNTDLSAVLDMDRWQPAAKTMDAAEITQVVRGLREDIASSFRGTMSALAKAEWQTPRREEAN